MSRTLITMVRHGQTEWNAQGRMQGHLDSPLTPLGRRQAQALAEALDPEAFAAIYSSDLGRALETARAIAGGHGRIELEPGLRERHLGCFQGKTWQQLDREMPETVAAFRSADADWEIPDGESVRQRYRRVVQAVEKIADRHTGRSVLLVTHGGAIDTMMRYVLDLEMACPRRYSLFNAARHVFSRADRRWRLDSWGIVDHLGRQGTHDDT